MPEICQFNVLIYWLFYCEEVTPDYLFAHRMRLKNPLEAATRGTSGRDFGEDYLSEASSAATAVRREGFRAGRGDLLCVLGFLAVQESESHAGDSRTKINVPKALKINHL
ncbi:hypothetical protein [Janthinobacterium sp. B9-8]|uniref:hypothetical protein n=1 Tax=Janthinobacterium sp. B9-8 TaxID=1236179 RepID=UPI00061D2295|nr:hypothetical protein [Janthinobacterium sp. B9-8]AMC35774.1 hypothetical protein VN23_14720 [Janthinobacterium sp. B9-8]